MCGRFSITASEQEIREYVQRYFNLDFHLDFKPQYNIYPGQNVLSIIFDGTNYRIGYLKWGFVPDFSTNKFQIINARAETIDNKKAFKNAFLKRRCLILADGFYEWKQIDKKKVPFRFIINNKIFPFAGVYDVKTLDDGTKEATCAIITTQANEVVNKVHDRMPVILSENVMKTYLDSNTNIEKLKSLLIPYSNDIEFYDATSIINKKL